MQSDGSAHAPAAAAVDDHGADPRVLRGAIARPDLKEIPADIDVLMLVQPQG